MRDKILHIKDDDDSVDHLKKERTAAAWLCHEGGFMLFLFFFLASSDTSTEVSCTASLYTLQKGGAQEDMRTEKKERLK